MKEKITSKDSLIISYLKDELPEEQVAELKKWISQSKSNKRYFDEFMDVWLTYNASLQHPRKFDHNKGFERFKLAVTEPPQKKNKPVRIILRKYLKYAALILVVILAARILPDIYSPKPEITPVASLNEIVVPFGSRAHFLLSDGTRVTLNAGSKLSYDNLYGIENRIVELEGEGYFQVVAHPQHPFIVKTSLVSIKALGTEFNVKTYHGEKTIETTLVKGIVEVEFNEKTEQTKTLLLKPAQKLTINYDDLQAEVPLETIKQTDKIEAKPKNLKVLNDIQTLAPADVDVIPIISWKEKRWIIEDESLAELAIELERRYDVLIVFKSEKLKTLRFSGTLLDEPLEQVLKVIGMTAPVNYQLEGKRVILKSN
jgi:ferric-dicitrate binding protein FerR (iron transport regulator)